MRFASLFMGLVILSVHGSHQEKDGRTEIVEQVEKGADKGGHQKRHAHGRKSVPPLHHKSALGEKHRSSPHEEVSGHKKHVSILNQELFDFAKRRKIAEVEAAKGAKLAMEKGASPLVHGLSTNPEFAKLSALEVAIKRRRAVVLEALFSPPSPVSYEALEEKIQLFPAKRRAIELFRTKIARYAIEESRQKDHTHDTSGRAVMEAITDARIFVFAEEYISAISLVIMYLVVVVLLVIFLYNLRIKQVPQSDVLLVPREEDTLWMLVRMCVCTFATTVPTSNIVEVAGYGLALIGGVVWSQVWTTRNDLGLVLILCSILQTTLTLICYMTYTPMVEPGQVSLTPSLYKLMMYPKKDDWNRSILRSCYYVIACSFSYFVYFAVLTPVNKMYDCPTPSVSDTYGFEYTVTRTVAVMWDVIIFFSLSLRVYRTLDTFVAFDLVHKMVPSSSQPNQEEADASIANA